MKGIGQAEYGSGEARAHDTSVQPHGSAFDPELFEHVEYCGAADAYSACNISDGAS